MEGRELSPVPPSDWGRPERVGANRAQSEVTGVALLTGVVAIVALVVGGFIIADFGGGDDGPTTDLLVDADATDLTFTHNGGDSVALADLRVTVYRDSGPVRLTPTATVRSGDDTLDPGERTAVAHGVSGPADVRVVVAHDPSSTVLLEDTVAVPR
jgi:hypothetical protein